MINFWSTDESEDIKEYYSLHSDKKEDAIAMIQKLANADGCIYKYEIHDAELYMKEDQKTGERTYLMEWDIENKTCFTIYPETMIKQDGE